MQERYLGDSHDYVKYSLLRHLSQALDMRIGLNWYLTQSEQVDKVGNKDGEKRHHFGSKVWDGWDVGLLAQLEGLQHPSSRSLARFYCSGILPGNTLFFDDIVPIVDRDKWHRRAADGLSPADLIFLDPDNGFEIASMARKRSPKYALFREAADFVCAGKTVVSIQFARQCNPIDRALKVREQFSKVVGCEIPIPVIRARLSPNLLFITSAPLSQASAVASAIKAFADGRDKIELVS